jgi:hypothetical protein
MIELDTEREKEIRRRILNGEYRFGKLVSDLMFNEGMSQPEAERLVLAMLDELTAN